MTATTCVRCSRPSPQLYYADPGGPWCPECWSAETRDTPPDQRPAPVLLTPIAPGVHDLTRDVPGDGVWHEVDTEVDALRVRGLVRKMPPGYEEQRARADRLSTERLAAMVDAEVYKLHHDRLRVALVAVSEALTRITRSSLDGDGAARSRAKVMDLRRAIQGTLDGDPVELLDQVG